MTRKPKRLKRIPLHKASLLWLVEVKRHMLQVNQTTSRYFIGFPSVKKPDQHQQQLLKHFWTGMFEWFYSVVYLYLSLSLLAYWSFLLLRQFIIILWHRRNINTLQQNNYTNFTKLIVFCFVFFNSSLISYLAVASLSLNYYFFDICTFILLLYILTI